MISGIIAGGSIWCIFSILFLIFPEPLSLAAALLVGPYAGGYFAARLGDSRAASVLTTVCSIATLALSVIYIPHTSWEYPHQLWGGAALLIILLVLGNFLFLGFGSWVGVRVRRQGQLKVEPLKKEAAKSEWDRTLAVETADMPGYSYNKLATLVIEERNLIHDLTVIKEQKAFENLSPELVVEKKVTLEKQLIDIILEKEKLIRETA